MAELDRIRSKILEIAGRKKNVTLSEIESLLSQLRFFGYAVTSREATHGKLFVVNGRRFMICVHHKGSRQVKSCYVAAFLDVMTELGLYE